MAATPEEQQFELQQQVHAHMNAEQLHREQRIAAIMVEQNRVGDIIHQEQILRQQQQQDQADHEQKMAEQAHQLHKNASAAIDNNPNLSDAQRQAYEQVHRAASEAEENAYGAQSHRLQQMQIEQQIAHNYDTQLKAANELNEQRLADMHKMNQEQQQLDALHAQRHAEALHHQNLAAGGNINGVPGLPVSGNLFASAPITTAQHTALGPIPPDLSHLDPHVAESIMRSRAANTDFDATLKHDQLVAHQQLGQPLADALREREQREIQIVRDGSPAGVVSPGGVHAGTVGGVGPQVVHPGVHADVHPGVGGVSPTASVANFVSPHGVQVVHPNGAMQHAVQDEINRRNAAGAQHGQNLKSEVLGQLSNTSGVALPGAGLVHASSPVAQMTEIAVKGYNPYNAFVIAGENGVATAPPGAYQKFGLLPANLLATASAHGGLMGIAASGIAKNDVAGQAMLHNMDQLMTKIGQLGHGSTAFMSSSSSTHVNAIKGDNPLAKYATKQVEGSNLTQKQLDDLWGQKYGLEKKTWGRADMTDAERRDRLENINKELNLQKGHRTAGYMA